MEVVAHEHFADLRYHSSDNVAGFNSNAYFNFHNVFINPGVTPNKYQNPGFAVFEITDDEEQKPCNL